MREQLNNNPILQLAIVGVLLLGGGFFAISTMGGGGEEAEEPAPTTSTALTTAPAGEAVVPATASALPPAGATSGAASRLPAPVLRAWKANETVALLFVRDGGIDDRLVTRTTTGLSALPRVRTFVVPASEISRYTAVSEGVGVERVPALVVISPKHLGQQAPTASVHYGFQSPESINQAIVDAGYKGPTVDYHP